MENILITMNRERNRFQVAAEICAAGDEKARRVFGRLARIASETEVLRDAPVEVLIRRYFRVCRQIAGIRPKGGLGEYWAGDEGRKGLDKAQRRLGLRS